LARLPAGVHSREDATIVAPATPGGTGAVSIVRLSGPEAFPVATKLTSLSPAGVPPRTLMRADVYGAGGQILDDALVVFFQGPHSFTGEDVVEFHLHGNPAVVEAMIRAACAAGAVPAEPGEFSRRAFLRGKMDLTQAEGLADLIAAKTDSAARAGLRQLRGGIRRAVDPLRQQMVSLLTVLEAAIDFAEEDDVPVVTGSQIAARISEIVSGLDALLRSYEAGHRFRDGANVAIAGVANVGKSRLLNRVAGEERAIVHEIPGTTRDYLHADVTVAGIPVLLVDTAGLRETGDPVEREGVRRSRDAISRADLTLFVLDGSRPAGEGDRAAYREVAGRPHLVVLNKSDLASLESGAGFAGEERRGVLRVSAKTGGGIEALVARIAAELAPEEGAILAQAPLTRARHRIAVEKALLALSRATASLKAALPLEFPAADVQEASGALAELVGEVAPEEVLDAIFGRFCIGK
jgi:tRNA modification GTPase